MSPTSCQTAPPRGPDCTRSVRLEQIARPPHRHCTRRPGRPRRFRYSPSMTPALNFCSVCGHAITRRVPPDDNRERACCDACGAIHYVNPKIVVGTVPVWDERVLLCRRAIEPRYGFWTLPAGFLEVDETTAAGALRETLEEAGARVVLTSLFTMLDVVHVHQVHLFYLAELLDIDFARRRSKASRSSCSTRRDMPWDELAFRTVSTTLRHFFDDRASRPLRAAHRHDRMERTHCGRPRRGRRCRDREPGALIHWLGPDDPFPPVARASRRSPRPARGRRGPVGRPARRRLSTRHLPVVQSTATRCCGGAPTRGWSSSPTSSASRIRCASASCGRSTTTGSRSAATTRSRTSSRACAAPRDDDGGTWIVDEMIDAYVALHRRGFAHSVETWIDGRLAGGLYGVVDRPHVLRRVDVHACDRRVEDRARAPRRFRAYMRKCRC